MRGDVIENRSQRSQAENAVSRNRDVVLARGGESQAHVAAGLACDHITDATESPREIIA